MEDREESEVDEADGRGESTGDCTAVEGDETSDSTVVEVMVRRRTGFFADGMLVDFAGAIVQSVMRPSSGLGSTQRQVPRREPRAGQEAIGLLQRDGLCVGARGEGEQ